MEHYVNTCYTDIVTSMHVEISSNEIDIPWLSNMFCSSRLAAFFALLNASSLVLQWYGESTLYIQPYICFGILQLSLTSFALLL